MKILLSGKSTIFSQIFKATFHQHYLVYLAQTFLGSLSIQSTFIIQQEATGSTCSDLHLTHTWLEGYQVIAYLPAKKYSSTI